VDDLHFLTTGDLIAIVVVTIALAVAATAVTIGPLAWRAAISWERSRRRIAHVTAEERSYGAEHAEFPSMTSEGWDPGDGPR
jgi:hypothetical protein